MHILFVNEFCGFLGGVEQNMAHSARALKQRGHTLSLAYEQATKTRFQEFLECFNQGQPFVNCAGLDSQLATLGPIDVIYVHRISRIEHLINYASSRNIRIVRMVHDHDLTCPRRHKYFVWNSQACHYPAGWRCWLDLAFIEKNPNSGRPQFKSLSNFFQELKLQSRLDQVLVASSYMKDELLMNGIYAERLQVLAPVVPQVPRPLRDEPTGKMRCEVLYVGQLIKGKGVDLLLRAFAIVSQSKPEMRLTIVGKGNAETGLKGLASQLGLQSNVEFAGFLEPSELDSVYSSCQVLAVPSRWPEPFGMIGLEAAAYAKPVVGFASGGIPDWLIHNETGLLVAERDIAGFASALKHLLEHPERARELGLSAKARAESHFRFSDYIDNLERVLSRI